MINTELDDAIVANLDDRWLTVVQIRGRVAPTAGQMKFVEALQRLLHSGLIERKVNQTSAVRKRKDQYLHPLEIEMFRRRQHL